MTDWDSWHKHVNYIIDTHGRWYGLGDGDGTPICDLPDLLTGTTTPEQWMSSEDLTVVMPAAGLSGQPHRATQLLLMDGLTNVDPSGQIPPAEGEYTLLMAMRGEDGTVVRRGGVISHADGDDRDGNGMPTELSIHALNLMDVWNTVPAVSWPNAWWKATPYPRTTDESGLEYDKPWDMARVEMSTRTTFTFKHGPAGFVIRRLAQESLDAVMMTQQDPDGTRWVDDAFHVVEVPEVDTTPVISLEARDGSLWDTVTGQARNAGVILGARLWWPGDPPVRSWELANSTMTAAQVDITPSQGEPYRQIIEQTFDHPMVILEVKEV